MSALCFVPHLFRSDITVAVQTDESPAGSIQKIGHWYKVRIFNDRGSTTDASSWLGTRSTERAARHLLVRHWGKVFGHE